MTRVRARAIGTGRGGFTIVELVAVIVLIALAGITAAPVLETVERSRRAGLRDEITRRLLIARAHAMTTGLPSGVRFDLGGQTACGMEVLEAGAAPTLMRLEGHARAVDSLFPGVRITDVLLDPGGTHDTLWFSHEGVPHYRGADGAFLSGLAQDATITLTGGNVVTVRMETGLIE